MGGLIQLLSSWGFPVAILSAIVIFVLLLQLVGLIIQVSGKTAPAFLKIFKVIKQRRLKIDQVNAALSQVKQSLKDFNEHYGKDNITKRNEWMKQVNQVVDIVHNRTDAYDHSSQLTYKLYRDSTRQRFFEFQRWLAAHPDTPVTYSEFRQIRKLYQEYHAELELHADTNGQVDEAWNFIIQDEARRLAHPQLLKRDRFDTY